MIRNQKIPFICARPTPKKKTIYKAFAHSQHSLVVSSFKMRARAYERSSRQPQQQHNNNNNNNHENPQQRGYACISHLCTCTAHTHTRYKKNHSPIFWQPLRCGECTERTRMLAYMRKKKGSCDGGTFVAAAPSRCASIDRLPACALLFPCASIHCIYAHFIRNSNLHACV